MTNMIRHEGITYYHNIVNTASWLRSIPVTSWLRRSEIAVFTYFWIWLVTFTFFIKGVNTRAADVNIFKIIYLALGTLFIVTFQVSRKVWMVVMMRFSAVVFFYAVFVCVTNLLFHIQDFGLNEQWRRDIGLMAVQMSELLSFLLFEILTIAMVVILHLLLHKADPVTEIRIGILGTIFETLDTFFDATRLILFGIMIACILRTSAINCVLLTLADLSMVFRRASRFAIILMISLCASIILLLQMITQLHHFQNNRKISCAPNSTITTMTLDVNKWIGIGKLEPEENLTDDGLTYIVILALVTIFFILVNENGKRISELGWRGERMFKDKVFLDSNKSISSHTLCLMKYGFYRYGIELTCIFIAASICWRSDIWATVYSFWLIVIVLAFNSSSILAVWTLLKYFIIVVIPLQYAVAVALFPAECFGNTLKYGAILSRAFNWLLPSRTISLCWDAIVILFVLCQANVFEFERNVGAVQMTKMSNSPKIFFDTDPMVYRKTTFGLIRYVLFWFLPHVVSVWLFLAATDSINVYSLLYGFCFALILWNSDSYFTSTSGRTRKLYSICGKDRRWSGSCTFLGGVDEESKSDRWERAVQPEECVSLQLRKLVPLILDKISRCVSIYEWKRLLVTNVLIIFVKTCMQMLGCVFPMNLAEGRLFRLLRSLFGISCLKRGQPVDSQFLTWDVLCFISMIFHDRFLRSPFYIGMAIEAELTKKFSFKAAKILRELHERELAETRKRYEKNLKKIRKNMKRLTDAQKRTSGPKLVKPVTHQDAVTAGDYYMFQDSSSDVKICDLDSDSDSEEDSDDKQWPDEQVPDQSSPNIGKLIETVFKSDMEEAVKLAEATTQTPAIGTVAPSSDAEETAPTSEPAGTVESAVPSESPASTDEEGAQIAECRCSSIDQVLKKNARKDDEDETTKSSRNPSNIVFVGDGSRSLPPDDTLLVLVSSKPVSPSLNDFVSSTTTTIGPPTTSHSKAPASDSSSTLGVSKSRRSLYERVVTLVKFLKACIHGAMVSLSQFFNNLAREHKYVMLQLEKAKHAQRGETLPKTPSLVTDSKKEFSVFIRLLLSTHDLVTSRFNTVCFFFVLLAQIRNPTIYLLPLTTMVLCWGSLSVPRPSKLFFKAIFAYTVILVVFDSVVRSPFVSSSDALVAGNNTLKVNPVFTVERDKNYSMYYLLILLTVLWQKLMLMNLGLWDRDELSTMRWRGNLIRKPWRSIKQFFVLLFYDAGDKIPVDVYTHMFCCEFVNIFIFIFGFASITEEKEEGVSKYFSENKIPPTFLLIFVVQCVTIFLDRWIYLQRNLKAKILFQYIQIVIVHIMLFIVLPGLTLNRLNTMFFPSLWYIMKFSYFLLSAYQIRNGYPSSVHGHALCQSFNVINLYLYQIYLIFPFVYELRTVTDWMWTETTLTLTEWLGMEDIFCQIFVLKCWRDYDNKYSYRRGAKITGTIKLLQGGGIVLLFFLLLLFPLAFFAYGHVTGKTNIPEDMELSYRIGSTNPVFMGYARGIRSFSLQEWSNFQRMFEHSPAAFTFLSEYYHDDVGVVRFANFSVVDWIVPPVVVHQMIEQLVGGQRMEVTAEWKLNRNTEDSHRQTLVTGRQVVELSAEEKRALLMVLRQESDQCVVKNLTPKFLKVGSFTNAIPVEALSLESEDGDEQHSAIMPFMTTIFKIDRNGSDAWWTANEYCDEKGRKFDVDNEAHDIIIYTFNDKIFPTGIISYVSAQGILGLYTTFLVSFGYLIRRMCRGRVNQIFLDYLPNVDCILQLLMDIYFVRENRDGKLEEDLYAKLIFLFRSPETLIQWTRQHHSFEVV